jgi:hypothetical protein
MLELRSRSEFAAFSATLDLRIEANGQELLARRDVVTDRQIPLLLECGKA